MLKAKYVDGFVLIVPKKEVANYKKLARLAGKVWKEHGALQYVETVADDMKTQVGVPFPKLAKAKSNEVVIFSWISYKSKTHRNSVNAKVMKDPRISKMCNNKMPFDAKRMTYGGFKVLFEQL